MILCCGLDMDLTAKRHYAVRETDAVDHRHPVDFIEPVDDREGDTARLAGALGRLLRWLISGGSLNAIGARVLVLVWMLRPDLIDHQSLASIAKRAKVTRAAANAWACELRDIYGLRSPHGRPDSHREGARRRATAQHREA
jgi:hypothetical protein